MMINVSSRWQGLLQQLPLCLYAQWICHVLLGKWNDDDQCVRQVPKAAAVAAFVRDESDLLEKWNDDDQCVRQVPGASAVAGFVGNESYLLGKWNNDDQCVRQVPKAAVVADFVRDETSLPCRDGKPDCTFFPGFFKW